MATLSRGGAVNLGALRLSWFLWAAFAFAAVAAMIILLDACGLVLPGYGRWHEIGWTYCGTRAPEAQSDDTAARLLAERARQLELGMAQQQAACLARLPSPRRSAAPAEPQRQATVQQPAVPPQTQAKPPRTEGVDPSKSAEPKLSEPKPPPSSELRMPPNPTSDLSFLKGCWRTDPFRHLSSQPPGLSTYCFDESGRGQLDFRRPSEPTHICRAAARATYEAEKLHIRDSDTTCADGSAWYADDLQCHRAAGDIAECSGQSQTPGGVESWTVQLHRMN